MGISNKQMLMEYLNIGPAEFEKFIVLREELMKLEHSFYSESAIVDFEFYSKSSFLIFSHYQDEYERDHDTDWGDMIKSINAAGLHTLDHVLDFGCGIGSAGINLETRMPCAQVNFYEPNDKSSKFIKHRAFMQSNLGVVWDRDTVFDTRYDLIIAWGVFEHLQDNEAFSIFVKMLSALTDQGKIFLKNFYSDTDDYRFHYAKGPKMTELFKRFDDKIIYANHSDK